jgi:lipoprotein-releasing system ATP-binding protein
MTAEHTITISGLHKSYREPGGTLLHILRGLDLSVPAGGITVIHGKSGSGKSTLLHIMGLLSVLDKGTVLVNGTDARKLNHHRAARFRNEELGFVFQSHHLLPDFSALENVMIPALIKRWDRKKVRQRAEHLLGLVGLTERRRHRPAQLSGGECQRVAIARALMNRPAVVLADEPMGNLDRHTAVDIERMIARVCREEGHTFVVVSHDLQAFADSSSRFYLEEGQLREESHEV